MKAFEYSTMKRRTFVTAATGAAAFAFAGCLGEADEDEVRSDDEHVTALRADIDDRGVEIETIGLEDDVLSVEHGYDEEPNNAIADVAMAFVDRIADDWDVERLDGYLRDDDTDWAWHAEARWARAYADGEIGPDEYGARLSETLTREKDIDR